MLLRGLSAVLACLLVAPTEAGKPSIWDGRPLPPSRGEGTLPSWGGARSATAVRGLIPIEAVVARHVHSLNVGVRVPSGSDASDAIAAGIVPLDDAPGVGTASASVWIGLKLGNDSSASGAARTAVLERRARLLAAATDLGGSSRNITRQIAAMHALNASAAHNDTGPLREAFGSLPRATRLPRADGTCAWAASLQNASQHNASKLNASRIVVPGGVHVGFAGAGRAHVGAECWVDDGSTKDGQPWDISDWAPEGIDLAVLVLIPGVPRGVNLTPSEVLNHAVFRPRVAGAWAWSRAEQAWRSWAGGRLSVTLPPSEYQGYVSTGVAVHLGVVGSLPIWTEDALPDTGSGGCESAVVVVEAWAWAESAHPVGGRKGSRSGPARGRMPVSWGLGGATTTHVLKVSAGVEHSLVLLEDGSVRAFGRGLNGRLGYGLTTDVGGTASTVPSERGPVPLGGRAVAVSAGGQHSLVLLEDGSVRAFGFGSFGQLGYGSTSDVGGLAWTVPSERGPVPLGGRAVAVSAGWWHSLVLLEDGSVRAFGRGLNGRLGYGSTSDVGASPVSLQWMQAQMSSSIAPQGTSDVLDRASGCAQTDLSAAQLPAVTDRGRISIWQPVVPSAQIHGRRQIAVSAGGEHSLVLLEDGSVRAFGSGSSGRLGYGSTDNVGHTPSTLPSSQGGVPLGGRAVAVSGGWEHSLVLREDGSVRAFGLGDLGRLGYGSTDDVGDAPSRMLSSRDGVLLGGRAMAVSAGGFHSLVLLEDGSVRAFGWGAFGQLGYGAADDVGDASSSLPSSQGGVPLGGRAVAVAAGMRSSLVLLEDGSVRAFGRGSWGRLGYGSTDNVGDTPSTLPSSQGGVLLGGRAVAVSGGGYHSLVLLEDGNVRAFGLGDLGRLGYGSTDDVGDTPSTLPSLQGGVPLGGRAVAVAAGFVHSLVLLEDGSVRAFGSGGSGRLGYGSTADVGDVPSSLPSSRGGVPLGGRAVAVSAGSEHSLVLLEDGSVRAFGLGDLGRLGYGSTDNVGHSAPTWARDMDAFPAAVVVHSPRDSFDATAIASQLVPPVVLAAGSPSLPQAATSINATGATSIAFPAFRLSQGPFHLWPEAAVQPPPSAMPPAACSLRPVAMPSASIGIGPSPMVCDFADQDDWDVFRISDSFGDLQLDVSAWSCELAPTGTTGNASQLLLSGSFWHVAALGLLEPGDQPSTFLVRADRPHELLPWPCAAYNVTSILCTGSPPGTGGPQRSWLRLKARDDLVDVSVPLPVPTRYAAPAVDPDQDLGGHGSVPGARIVVRGHGFGVLPGRPVSVDNAGDTWLCLDPTVLNDTVIECAAASAAFPEPWVRNLTVTVDGQLSSPVTVRAWGIPTVVAVSPSEIYAGETVPVVVLNGTDLGVAPHHVSGIAIGGVACVNVVVLEARASVACRGFVAPEIWPDPDSLSVTIGGRPAQIDASLLTTHPVPVMLGFSLAAGNDARPGSIVVIRGERFESSLSVPPVARFGAVVATDCNVTSPSELRCRMPVVTGDVVLSVQSRAGLWSAPAGGGLMILAPEVHSISAAWGNASEWHPLILPSLSIRATRQQRLLLRGVGLSRPPLQAVRLGTSSLCGSLVVVNDTTAECVGLVDAAGRDAGPLTGWLRVAVPWPAASTFLPQSAEIHAVGPTSLSGALPQDATPGSVVALLGESIPGDAAAVSSLTVGGVACASIPSVGASSLSCRLPDRMDLGSLPDRDGDALHVRLTLASGYATSLLSAVRLSGSVAVSWSSSGDTEPIIVMPSSADDVFPLGANATTLGLDGRGATECALSVDGSAASLMGVSRATPPAGTTRLEFPGVGVSAGFGSNVTLSASCGTTTGATASPVTSRWLVVPSARASFDVTSSEWLITASASSEARLTPPLSAMLELVPAPYSLDLPRVASLFRCEVVLKDGLTHVQVDAVVSPAAGIAGSVAGAMMLSFPPLSTLGFALGARLRLDAGCEWAPTGERFELPSSEIRLANASVTLSLPPAEAGLGIADDGTALVLSGVPRRVRVTVSAPPSSDPRCSLSLSGESAQAVATMTVTSTDVAVGGMYADLLAGATGTGEAAVSVTCRLWGGERSIASAPASWLSLRLATLRSELTASGLRPLALSSGSVLFALAPPPVARLVVTEVPAWAGADSDGTSCAVAALDGMLTGWTQAGTTTRFLAGASDTGRVLLDAVSLTGTSAFPLVQSHVALSVACDHPVAGPATPFSLGIIVTGGSASWSSAATMPRLVAVSAVWPRTSVSVVFSSAASAELASAVRCRAAVPNASRVEGSEAFGDPSPTGNRVTVTFDKLSVVGRRGSSFELRMACSVGELELAPVLSHRFTVMGCLEGQQPRAGSDDLCEVCAADEYSDGGDASLCAQCPSVGVRCVEGVLTLLRGHYRPPRDAWRPITADTELHPCLNEEACTLNVTSREYGCAEGYSGLLCGVCSEGWALFGKACGRCWGGDANAGVVAALALAVLAGAAFMARRTAGATSAGRSDRSIAIRQLLSHAQGLGALTLFRSQGTAMFQAVAGITQGVSASPMSWGPVQCALGLDFLSRFWATALLPVAITALTTAVAVCMTLARAPDVEHGIARTGPSEQRCGREIQDQDRAASKTGAHDSKALAVSSFSPASDRRTISANPMLAVASRARASPGTTAADATTAACPAPVATRPTASRCDNARGFFAQHKYVVTLAIVLFLTYMSLVNLAVTALDCEDRPIAGVTFLAADLSVECFTGRHSAVVAGAASLLGVVGVGFPLAIVAALRGETDRPSLRFLSDGYRPGLRWWEATVLLRKMGLVMAASLVADASSQVAAAIFVLVPSLMLQTLCWPFEQSRFNVLETMSVVTMIGTATLSLVFLRVRGGEDAVLEGREQQVDAVLDAVVTLLLVGANGLVMLLQVLVVCRTGSGSDPVDRAVTRCRATRPGSAKGVGGPVLSLGSARLPSLVVSSSSLSKGKRSGKASGQSPSLVVGAARAAAKLAKVRRKQDV